MALSRPPVYTGIPALIGTFEMEGWRCVRTGRQGKWTAKTEKEKKAGFMHKNSHVGTEKAQGAVGTSGRFTKGTEQN